jgi:Second Messenger Oligonucleotide or Dinucleotide Synthetase domain
MNLNNRPNQNAEGLLLQRRQALTGILETTVTSLELTPGQHAKVEEKYHECGHHLSKALGLAQDAAEIFPQGSMRLGTVIRPLRDVTEVFDLDVVFRIAAVCTNNEPKQLHDAVGEHLREKYDGALSPLPKGWRLDFGEYHLDVIPAMDSTLGGENIAITSGNNWWNSNPRGYATWFEERSSRLPKYEDVIRLNEVRAFSNSARIEPLPEHTTFKTPLHRIVQISKRYRDYYFNRKTKSPELSPASIVVTTLLTKAYEKCVQDRTFASGFDLLQTCVEDMPNHLEAEWTAEAGRRPLLRNPSLPNENLVAKWTDESQANAFHTWHRDYAKFLRELLLDGAPQRRLLSEALGERAINSAFAKQTDSLNLARRHQVLTVAPTIGLTIANGIKVADRAIHSGK